MRNIAISSGHWTVLGTCTHKKAMLVLKHIDRRSIPLSEKDLKQIVSVLDAVRTAMKEATSWKTE